jgi:tetratricopeptide (TPR) repeat protein
MAPEQLAGDRTDAAADQFSFCVALFEALYGEPPFEGKTFGELRANVTAGRIRAVRGARAVPARLRPILARGLSVLPKDRYPSMQALLADLEPESGRRRVLLGTLAAAAFVAAAVTFGVIRTSHTPCRGLESRLTGVWDPAKKAAMRAAFLASGKPDAEDTADRAGLLLDRYAVAWRKTRVDACEATQVRGDQSAHLLDLRVACLDRRLRELSSLTDLFTAGPDGQIVDKAVLATSKLTSLDGCSDADALQSVVPPPADATQRVRVEELRGRLSSARALESAGKYDRALTIAREVDDAAGAIAYAPLRGEALYRRGVLEELKGDGKSAEQHLDAALALAAEGHDDGLAAHIWAPLLQAIGRDQARYADATLLIPAAESAVRRAGDDDALAELYDARGRLLGAQDKQAESQRMFEEGLALRQKTLPPDDPALSNSFNYLGIAHDLQGRYRDALDAYERALAIRERALGPDHPLVAVTLNNIGIVYKEEGDYDRARHMYERAVAINEKMLGNESPQLANSLDSLANVLDRQGKYEDAERVHQRALAIREKVFGPEHPDVAISLNNLGDTLEAEGKYDEAQHTYERALAIRLKTLGPESQLTGTTIENLADLLARRSRFAEAVREHELALAIYEKNQGATHPDLAYPLLGLAEAHERMGHYLEAVAAAERALRLREANATPPEYLGHTRFVLARSLWGARGDRTRARALAEQARADFAASAHAKEMAEVDRWLSDHGG